MPKRQQQRTDWAWRLEHEAPEAAPLGHHIAVRLLAGHGQWLVQPLLNDFHRFLDTDKPEHVGVRWDLLLADLRHPATSLLEAPATNSDLEVLRLAALIGAGMINFERFEDAHALAVMDAVSAALLRSRVTRGRHRHR